MASRSGSRDYTNLESGSFDDCANEDEQLKQSIDALRNNAVSGAMKCRSICCMLLLALVFCVIPFPLFMEEIEFIEEEEEEHWHSSYLLFLIVVGLVLFAIWIGLFVALCKVCQHFNKRSERLFDEDRMIKAWVVDKISWGYIGRWSMERRG